MRDDFCLSDSSSDSAFNIVKVIFIALTKSSKKITIKNKRCCIMKKDIKVGIFQLDSSFERLDENIEFIKNIVQETMDEVDLFVLGELFNTGYEMDKIKNRAKNFKDVLKEFKTLTKETSTAFVCGSFGEIENSNLYNTSYFISCGNVLEKYRKIHLFSLTGEDKHFSSGSSIKTFSFLGWDIGLSICYDLRFPEMYRVMREDGIDLILLPANWPVIRKDHWLTLSKARAIENQVYMVSINRTGNDNNIDFGGNSVVYSPWGEKLLQMDKSQRFDIIKMSKEVINETRSKLDSFLDRRKDLYKF
ncbi:MAG: hypothetical protein FXF47_05750 [Candidatus Mcinerneyibacterium aminivorans]|uniref:CN hydrolase domain-containing protein n=1 Tax=Candidatus Mcinerneyibacterium aminivorans TaxID=2703815 RepID=A0A5D0MI09_9BACT|nr:MAG: hypothetical protein FXF47_05750 [Candidatus Mcinerneyibacterium aminivorans]